MSDQSDCLIQPFLEFWNRYVTDNDQGTSELLGSAADLNGSWVFSRERLDAISKAMDVYMRSSEFLNALQQNIDTIIATKKQMDAHQASQHTLNSGALGQNSGPPLGTASHSAPTDHMSEMWNRFADVSQDPIERNTNRIGVTPYDVLYEEGSLSLLRFRSDYPIRQKEPVLICFSLINRPYVLDLQPDRSVIRQLLQHGLNVYMIDWGVPTEDDHTLRLHDYVCRLMKNVVDFICESSDSTKVSLLGYCMGGTMAALYTSLYQQQIRNLILLAAPIDFGGDESLLNIWTRKEYFDVDGLIDAFGNCPGSLLQLCFRQTKPVQNYVEKYINFCEKKDDDAFLENFFSMERWANDNIPVAGETFREFVKMFYQRNLLVQGKLRLNGIPIDLAMINCPLLMITADRDHLVPPCSTLVAKNHVASTETAEMNIWAGHMGLAVSSKAHRHLWPDAAAWIAAHSTPRDRGSGGIALSQG